MSQGSLYINGSWVEGTGECFESFDPSSGASVWGGAAASAADVNTAVAAARAALPAWSGATFDERAARVTAFGKILETRKEELARAISLQVGKPLWESRTEVAAMIGKIPLSIQAHQQRRAEVVMDLGGGSTGVTRYKPHGVVGVFGPFNLPGHVPNGHIVPALLEGNTLVYKPSELTPEVGRLMFEFFNEAGFAPGVVNLLQGARATGVAIVDHAGLDGIYFTGSLAVGKAIARALADRPQTILALELGGNNPLVVHEVLDVRAAAYHAIQSGYITSGQRCTCAQRLIVPAGENGDRFIEELLKMLGQVRVGAWDETPEPFMGPVISPAYADKLLKAQDHLIATGGRALLSMRRLERGPAFLSPGLIDLTDAPREDEELFGPVLLLIRTQTFEQAVQEANQTIYGLAAALLSDHRENWDYFHRHIRAGVVNWNRPTSGASSTMPFGGAGASGNHRPAGYWSVDYCSWPVATIEVAKVAMPEKAVPGINL